MTDFAAQIAIALGPDFDATAPVLAGSGEMPSYFDVTGLAIASVSSAAGELAALRGTTDVRVNRRHALQWFDITLRPEGWTLPSAWDAIAGDYKSRDGWIRLHTNAPHHRAAALSVLDCPAERETVAEAVQSWAATELETAVLDAGGCAAEMRSVSDWATHPQGVAVAAEPLIHWEEVGVGAAAPLALEGLRVLDLTRVLAGPVATRFLAAFGASVLRIDPPGWNEPAVEQEVTLGKACAGLDLRLADDRSRFETLLQSADILVHGYRPGALQNLGYDTDARHRANPTLIEISLCAYGWTGPWAMRRGFDSLVQMSSGIADTGMAQSGSGCPTPLPVQALDHATGYLLAAAALRALRVRAETGRVMHARLSLARSAHLLVNGGTQPLSSALSAETQSDYAPEIESTGWGPARRIAFPVTIDGHGPKWRFPAGQLCRHAPDWPGRV